MSAAAAAAPADVAADAVPVKKSKKKLIVIIAALTVLLAVGGGAAVFVLKQRAAAPAAELEGEAGDAQATHTAEPVKTDASHAPTFMPLDPFTVNLADREAERFAQVGITLEVLDAKAADLLKAYMPAIRNNILLALGAKTAGQLMERDGKMRLAAEIRREALRPLGYEIELAPEALGDAAAAGQPAPAKKKSGNSGGHDDETIPIRTVHFSNFIIQ